MFWRTYHTKPDPKLMGVHAPLLMGSKTRLDPRGNLHPKGTAESENQCGEPRLKRDKNAVRPVGTEFKPTEKRQPCRHGDQHRREALDRPSLGHPQHKHSTAGPRSRSRNHARGSLGSLGLVSLFACCYAFFSLGWFGIFVATLLTSIGRASRSPKRVSLGYSLLRAAVHGCRQVLAVGCSCSFRSVPRDWASHRTVLGLDR
jgi:hypothetical protein